MDESPSQTLNNSSAAHKWNINIYTGNVKALRGTDNFRAAKHCPLLFCDLFTYLLVLLFLFSLACNFLIKPCLWLSVTSTIQSLSFPISCSRGWVLKRKETAMFVRKIYTGFQGLITPALKLKEQMPYLSSALHRCPSTFTHLSLLGTVSPFSTGVYCVPLCWA